MLGFVVETQRGFRKRLERDKTREKVKNKLKKIFEKKFRLNLNGLEYL